MQSRRLGKTGWDVSEIGFGAWAIGGEWGETDDERLIGRLLREREERLVVATKFGRRVEQDPALYTYENLRSWLERSRENLGVEVVDLVQLHSPPWETYYLPEVHEACSRLVQEGLVRAYGVSVEKVEEGLKAIEYDGVATVQLIFNMLRQRPAELFFDQARRRDVGVIVRVPLASGLLTGKFDRKSTFAANDHRAYNRQGEQFDRGETFSGVDYNVGLEVVEELKPLVPPGATLAQLALRWILTFDAVSTVIPGAKTPEQARANAAAADLPAPSPETMERIAEIYRERVAPLVHQRW
jgi:aryl-alcohol dehydrogenase-like predicted oxidoreductase